MLSRNDMKELRRQQILEAALELFVRRGYAATKISDIAQRANMSTGLMFHYFESKEKLYEELVSMGLNGSAYPVSLECECAIDYFLLFTSQLFDFMRQYPASAKMFVLMSQARRSEGIPAGIRNMALGVNTIEQFVPIIEQGQREGSIRSGNALSLSNAFWCSIQGIAENYAADSSVPLPEAEWIVNIIRKGDCRI